MQAFSPTHARPPLAGWLGGKSRLAKHIIQRIPEHACYVEPFCGAAWVLFRKPESKVEVLNDINRDVANLYRCLQWHREELIRYLQWVLVSREDFERLKMTIPESLTDIQRAARFYYLQQNAFAGRITRLSFGYSAKTPSSFNILRMEEHLSAAHIRLSRVYIECLPFLEVIKRYDSPDTFFYVDPPYWGCENDYGSGVFSRENLSELADVLGSIQGKFLMSYNDVPEVRKLFSRFSIEEVTTRYSCNAEKLTEGKELLIFGRR